MSNNTLIDGSKIITEALVRAGADVFIGYPITPSNLFYSYGQKRYPSFYAAPDEITVLQWMSGFSATGKLPITATAFPGLALMTESLNMAYMMELPMVLIITQRLGPSTGSATTGAQGDLSFINGCISGGYPLPVFCPSNLEDCWTLAQKSLETAVKFRTPVILLTSKEMVMTNKSFDLSSLPAIKPIEREVANLEMPFRPYQAGENLVPPFVPVGNKDFQVRINSSTHDFDGLIRKGTPEALQNTKRLKEKFEKRIAEYFSYDLDEEGDDLIITYGISSDATRDAVAELRNQGKKIALLVLKTLLPVSPEVFTIMNKYQNLIFVEENISGQLREMLYGKNLKDTISGVNKIGSMITPSEIVEHVINIGKENIEHV